MTLKLVYEFQDKSSTVSAGWVETWYADGSDPSPPGNRFFNNSELLPRRRILSKDYALVRVSATVVGQRSQTYQQSFTLAQGRGLFNSPSEDESAGEQPWDAVEMAVSAAKVVLRRAPIRGLPQGAIVDTTNFQPSAAFLTPWNNFLTWVTTAPVWNVRQRVLGGGTTPPTPFAMPVTITVNPDLRSLKLGYAVGLAPAAPRGTLLLFEGFTGFAPVNHLWRVRSNDGTFIQLYPGRRVITGAGNTTTGAIFLVTYVYTPLSAAVGVRGMKRDTGRPRSALRGRARAR